MSDYNEKYLSQHPGVREVTSNRLYLTYELRLKLFKEWKKDPTRGHIKRLLEENGLGMEWVGKNYFNNVYAGFYMNGYPMPWGVGEEFIKYRDLYKNHPLLASGLFIGGDESKNTVGLHIHPEVLKEIARRYPAESIADIFKKAGLDPLDIGTSRITTIKKKVLTEEKRNKILQDTQPVPDPPVKRKEETSSESMIADDSTDIQKDMIQDEVNPYINTLDKGGLILKDAFYNDAFSLLPLGKQEILRIFQLDSLPGSDILSSSAWLKLQSWKPNGKQIIADSETALQITMARHNAMNRMVSESFARTKQVWPALAQEQKRSLCEWIRDLPQDPGGYYTVGRVLQLAGISKSVYYRYLSDESYGRSAMIREQRDEEDIELIRKVLDYKGFRKGERQICMLMPKVTGKSLSRYRIRQLMDKYGIRTGLRRPGKNRKSMKELIKRNKKVNLLMRKFRMHRPNEVRLTDVTYLDYGDGKRAYGSASLDPATDRLICFVVSENNDLQLALDTLDAMDAYPAKRGAILHSDQGILYMTDEFQAKVVERQLHQSMSRRGNCWDNAPQEGFFGKFKTETMYTKCSTLEELNDTIQSYSVYYNTERGIWDRGKMTPVEYEAYLDSLDASEWQKYMLDEEKRYLEMKAESAKKAELRAREYKAETEKRLEEIKFETKR